MDTDSFAKLKDDLRIEPEIRHLLQSAALSERSHFFILTTDAPLQAKAVYEILAEAVPAIREEPVRFHRYAPRNLEDHVSPADKFHQLIIQILSPLYYWNKEKEKQDERDCIIVLDVSAGQKKDAAAWTMFFQRLNEVRNVLMDTLPGPLILFIPTFFELDFCYNAPDFWSIRSAFVHARSMPPAQPSTDQKRPSAGPFQPDSQNNVAIKQLEALIKEAEKRFEKDPENFTAARALDILLTRRGDYELKYGHLEAAFQDYSKSLDVMRKLLVLGPERTEWKRDLTVSLERLGNVHEARGELQNALDAYSESLEVRRKLLALDPERTEWQRDISVSLNKVGDVYTARGELQNALDAYSESLEVRRKLLALDPERTEWQRDISVSLDRLGDVHKTRGELQNALDAYSESLEVRRKLLTFDPERPSYHYDAGFSYYKLAMLFEKKEVIGEALDYMRKAYKELKPLSEHYPDVTNWKNAAEICADEIVRLEKI
ncbi:tetratricopeptide repeat protein [Desulfococcaceae bacterium HSG7]|nr:tetratricopeptide repeat protein [Desulfococcaceae bacterium HSG7]